MESKFGWLLSGPIPKLKEENTVCQVIDAQQTGEDNLHEILSRLWEVSKIPEEYSDADTTEVQKNFESTIQFNQDTGRDNVRLPWKGIKHNLPANFTLARKRLSNLKHTQNRKDPELIQKYNNTILDQLKRGFIEPVHGSTKESCIISHISQFLKKATLRL